MPRANTECTELSVGFGLLGIEPFNLSSSQINSFFEKTVDVGTYNKFLAEFQRYQRLYRKFYNLGFKLRTSSLFIHTNIRSIRWEGPRRQASTASVPKDILAVNTPISIKDDSDVVGNLSPYKLFMSLPQGISSPRRAPNWYFSNAPDEYQLLYSFARNTWYSSFPEDVSTYHKSIKRNDRKILAHLIKQEDKRQTSEYLRYHHEFYIPMCYKVAQASADMFNHSLTESLRGPTRNAVTENIIREFFRIGESKYLLCGLEQGKEFAVEIPDLTTWKTKWRFRSLTASPDVSSGREQSVVKFSLLTENKETRQQFEAEYRAEIRWSHGRLNGNPEAKLYKEFSWTEVPFVTKVIEEQRFQKIKLIGAGGFGVVYEALDTFSGEAVAVKELSKSFIAFQEHEFERFRREVKIQSALDHPNILSIIDSGLSAPVPWFATPLAQCNLLELLETDISIRTDYGRIAHIFSLLLEGMKFAHDQGVVHRDLKPENILVFDQDEIKVGDFGLGKRSDLSSSNIALTASSEALGSLYYAAPEQLRSSKDADYRSDIYSLGKILYNCLTGEIPFPYLNLNLIDNRYRMLIAQCVEDNPDKRFQSVDALLEAFKAIHV